MPTPHRRAEAPRIYRNLPVPGCLHESTSEALQIWNCGPPTRALLMAKEWYTPGISRAAAAHRWRPARPPMVGRMPRATPRRGATLPTARGRHLPVVSSGPTRGSSKATRRPSCCRASSARAGLRHATHATRHVHHFHGHARRRLGSMRRFCAPADETPNAFGAWPEPCAPTSSSRRPRRAPSSSSTRRCTDLRATLQRLAALIGPAEALEADADAIMAALGLTR